jgi:cysteine desulfurase
MQASIYMDNNSTTPLDPEVLKAMLPYYTSVFGNPSSVSHSFGKSAAQAVAGSKIHLAELLGADPAEIIFTSGATEAINMAIKGVFARYKSIGNHLITCKTEHKAVLDVCSYLQKQGAEITFLPVDSEGAIDLEDLRQAIRKETILVSLMFANNETGVIHPIKEIAEICKEHGVLFFSDATQAVGKVSFSVKDYDLDMLCCSAHKFYGPKGVGALFVRKTNRSVPIGPLIHGGGQQAGLRGGTLNVPAIVGMGKAALLCRQSLDQEAGRLSEMRNCLERSLLRLEQTMVNGNVRERLPHVTNLRFRFIRAEQIMSQIRQLAVSPGSACTSGSTDPSHVLTAIGLDKEDARASLRFSLGRFTTQLEVDQTIQLITTAVSALRSESPAWALYKDGMIS